MSRGGEAFGGGSRPPPPPLILNPPPHLSTQLPPRYFQTTSSPFSKDKTNSPLSPSSPFFNRKEQNGSGGPNSNSNNKNSHNNNNSGNGPAFEDSGGWNSRNTSSSQPTKPLEKDVNAVFSKVQDPGSNLAESVPGGGDSDAHPLLGITPAAPGDPFDFNPILSNPAVTRILAGSSGRIPQWEPMPDSYGNKQMRTIFILPTYCI